MIVTGDDDWPWSPAGGPPEQFKLESHLHSSFRLLVCVTAGPELNSNIDLLVILYFCTNSHIVQNHM